MIDIAVAWPAPLWPYAALAAIAVAAVGASIVRTPRAGLLRLLALAALAGLILEPERRIAEETPLDDLAVILVDESASQRLDGRDAAREDVVETLRRRLARMDNLSVVETTVDGEEETRLGEAAQRAIGDNPRARLAGVFVVTDGQASDELDPSGLPPGAPVHLLLTGRRDERDRVVTLLSAPRYGIVRDQVTVSFRIDDVGPDGAPLAGADGEAAEASAVNATVRLRVDGDEILAQPVPVGREISFAAPLERPGRTVIELEVEPLDGELSTRNNLAVLPVEAIRDRLRVLLISGEPHAGERVWRNLLKSDPAIDLVHFTILRPSEKQGSDGVLSQRELALIEFPQDELFIEKLTEFDLVIFDRYTYRNVLKSYHFDNVARYVEDGGAVLVSSGPEFNGFLSLAARRNFGYILPVAPIESAIEEPFRPELSADGERHPVTRALPERDYWGRWLRLMPILKRSGRTLMEGPGERPLLVLDRFGEGRVGVILSDHVWLWARGFDGGGPHAELLRRIAHWLMKEPELEEEQLRLIGDGDDLVVERRTVEDAVGEAQLDGPDGVRRAFELERAEDGLYRARLANAPRGVYRAEADGLFAVGSVGLAAPPEYQAIVMDRRPLAPAVEASGGGIFLARDEGAPTLRRIGDGARRRSGEGWAGVVSRGASRTDAVRAAPLLSPYAWLAIVAAMLLSAWLVEGRRGRS